MQTRRAAAKGGGANNRRKRYHVSKILWRRQWVLQGRGRWAFSHYRETDCRVEHRPSLHISSLKINAALYFYFVMSV